MAICSAIEHGLGIIATACCVLRPLLKRFYGSSANGTHQIEDTPNHPSTWHSGRVNTAQRKTRGSGKDGIEMEAVVTTVLPNRKGERGREWGRRNMIGNESEEELTKEGIFVHKTVEISTQEEVAGLEREESMGV